MASSRHFAAGKPRKKLARRENKGSVWILPARNCLDSGFLTTFASTLELRLRQKSCPLDALNSLIERVERKATIDVAERVARGLGKKLSALIAEAERAR